MGTKKDELRAQLKILLITMHCLAVSPDWVSGNGIRKHLRFVLEANGLWDEEMAEELRQIEEERR